MKKSDVSTLLMSELMEDGRWWRVLMDILERGKGKRGGVGLSRSQAQAVIALTISLPKSPCSLIPASCSFFPVTCRVC